MAINQNSQQDKLSKKIDGNGFFSKKKEIPLLQRDFRDLHTLAEQFEWLKLKRREKDRKSNEAE
jgi:hypothetical protein